MLVYIHQLGNNFAYVTPVGGGVDPGFGVGAPVYPSQGLPGLPDHPSQGLPSNPMFPNNSLPATPPPQVGPGQVVVLVRDQAGVWHYYVAPSNAVTPLPVPTPTPKA